jgi:hypothetical protein
MLSEVIVRKEGRQQTPIMVNQGIVIEVAQPIQGNQIYLKMMTNFQSIASFYHSVDSQKFYNKLGNVLKMTITDVTYCLSKKS